jgi:hypothetical protein
VTVDIITSISVLKFSEQVEFALLAIAFVGGVWMFLDASDRFGTSWAFVIVVFHLVVTLVLIIPALAILYALFGLYNLYLQRRRTEADAQPKFGFRPETDDPVAEARKLGVPSVFGGTGVAGSEIKAEERDEHLEELLAHGDHLRALNYAEEMFKTASEFIDLDGQARYQAYLQKLHREIG